MWWTLLGGGEERTVIVRVVALTYVVDTLELYYGLMFSKWVLTRIYSEVRPLAVHYAKISVHLSLSV